MNKSTIFFLYILISIGFGCTNNSSTNQENGKVKKQESKIDKFLREIEEEENRNINSFENENLLIKFEETDKEWEEWIDYELSPDKELEDDFSRISHINSLAKKEKQEIALVDELIEILQAENMKDKIEELGVNENNLRDLFYLCDSFYINYLKRFQIENEKSNLILKLDNGKLKEFHFTKEDSLETKYILDSYLPSINYYLVRMLKREGEIYYEGLPYFLINKSNGFQVELWSRPNISPSLNKIVVASFGIGVYNGAIRGFQIFSVTPDSLITEAEFRRAGEPSIVKWENDSTLYVKVCNDCIELEKMNIKFKKR